MITDRSWTRPGHALDRSHGLLLLTLLLWVRRVHGLADFSNYLSRIITSHSAHACDGQPLRLHCPQHSTISIQSAFYGSGEARLCQRPQPEPSHPDRNHSCSAFTALQKLLSECQSHRDCQLSVNHLLFGKDPCPGTAKYLHVDYKCKPTEHKRHVACDGASLALRCKPPKVLNIYAAVYGRGLGQSHTCPSNGTRPPPFECLNHEAVRFVSKSCYGKHKCAVVVSNRTFSDPCFPGTRKYLSVLYSCDEAGVSPKGSRRPEASGAVMSDSLSTYAYIRAHSETAALLFTSGVCAGLLLTLLALSVRVTCWCHRSGRPGPERRTPAEGREGAGAGGGEDEAESSLVSEAERKTVVRWEEATLVSEAAERAERIERRDMVVQEIWMNAYLNGTSCEPL
ncbi:protein eva-1 homolog C isoform X1 [Eucyclogobius newberryi]|uniref:protein eva-1 homolog C isoform X1 n=1 Tax=Eucyclogobius newberryi TaxID=166745 RepID=UPI003B5B59EA